MKEVVYWDRLFWYDNLEEAKAYCDEEYESAKGMGLWWVIFQHETYGLGVWSLWLHEIVKQAWHRHPQVVAYRPCDEEEWTEKK